MDIASGELINDFSVPGVKIRGGSTGMGFVYRSSAAYPSLALKVTYNQNDQLLLRPEYSTLKIASPLLGAAGTGKEMFFNSPAKYGVGGVMLKGNYPSGRPVQTGYQSVTVTASNYYPAEYATSARWGGIPTGTTGAASAELAYLEEEVEKNFFVNSWAESGFGKGWWLQGLKKLHFEDSRVVLIDSSGNVKEYIKGINYADSGHGAVIESSSSQIENAEGMLTGKISQKAGQKGFARFMAGTMPAAPPAGTDQWVVIDLGEERELFQVGAEFPKYWKEHSVWDYAAVSTSTDNQNWDEWKRYGEATLDTPLNTVDPLDNKIQSPFMAYRTVTLARYIKLNLGYPSVNTENYGSIIKRVYAVGDETGYRLLSGEKWPRLAYDSDNDTYTLTEMSGAKTLFDGEGLMTGTIDRRGRELSYLYENGNLVRVQYPEGAFMELEYDGNGRMNRVIDSSGRETQILTGSGGNITEVVYPDSTRRQFEYNARGLMVKDKKGDNEKIYLWDDAYPVLQQVQLPNNETRDIEAAVFKYLLNESDSSVGSRLDFPLLSAQHEGIDSEVTFEDGREEKTVSGKGWSASYLNDSLKVKTYFADDGLNKVPYRIERGETGWDTTDLVYDVNLNPVKIETQARDISWQYNHGTVSYEPTANETTHKTKDSTIQYNAQGQVTEVEERFVLQGAPSVKKLFTYDTAGNITQVEEQAGAASKITKFTFEANNDLTKVQYPDGKTNQMTYDGNGLMAGVINNNGTSTTVTRDSRGDIASSRDEENRTVIIERDIMGRVIKETSPTGRVVQYQWGITGCQSCGSDLKLTKITDSGNNEWEFKYDNMGNTIEMIYPDGTKLQQQHDTAGRLVRATNKRGQAIDYEYDDEGRLIKKTTPEGVVDFTYDGRDRLTSAETGDYHYTYQYGLGDELMFD
ncbi:MAG: hypothetical protein GY757_49955, partial [bacterium]|nr:hypothetical protein [bacterium]